MSVLPVVVCTKHEFEKLPKVLSDFECDFSVKENLVIINYKGILIEAYFDGSCIMFVASRYGTIDFMKEIIERIRGG